MKGLQPCGKVYMGGEDGRMEGEKKGGKKRREKQCNKNDLIHWAMLSRSKHYSRN